MKYRFILIGGSIKLAIFNPEDCEGKERILSPGDTFGDFSDVDPTFNWEKLFVKTLCLGAKVGFISNFNFIHIFII